MLIFNLQVEPEVVVVYITKPFSETLPAELSPALSGLIQAVKLPPASNRLLIFESALT
jgi:hypothetical protein